MGNVELKKRLKSTFKLLGAAALIGSNVLTSLPAVASSGAPTNFFGVTYGNAGDFPDDPNNPPPNISYFKTSTEPTPNGAKLHVDIYTQVIKDPVSLWLLVAINDGDGNVKFIPLRTLSYDVADNNVNHHVRRTFDLDYTQLNAELQAILPSKVKSMTIGPGSPLFVSAYWPRMNHRWGGAGRGGIFFMPGTPTQQSAAKMGRATELDIGYEITGLVATRYNTTVPNPNERQRSILPYISIGLKQGGQIKSRLESEGKYQVPLADAVRVKSQLYSLARDPNLAASVLGNDWTLQSEDRYMKRDENQELLRDANGNPIPDPMVDTFYDNDKFDAASNDTVIRWRKTEGNGYGSWNFKAGRMVVSPEGIADRTESSVDATDSNSSTIRKYADSLDPLNIFAPLFELNKSRKPSDYLQNRILTQPDDRHKFKLTHTSGLVIEVSFDEVQVISHVKGPEVYRYYQVEMDVEHPATQSSKVARENVGGISNGTPVVDYLFMNKLTEKAFLDGRPIMHTVEDLDPQSPINVKLAADKALAAQAIVALRDNLFGKGNWIPGANKYALSSYLAKHVTEANASTSVKTLLTKAREMKKAGKEANLFTVDKAATCQNLFR